MEKVIVNLKRIDAQLIRGFEYEDTLILRVDNKQHRFTPDEVLGTLNKLSELQSILTNALVCNAIKNKKD